MPGLKSNEAEAQPRCLSLGLMRLETPQPEHEPIEIGTETMVLMLKSSVPVLKFIESGPRTLMLMYRSLTPRLESSMPSPSPLRSSPRPQCSSMGSQRSSSRS